jgi:hypothetical protein
MRPLTLLTAENNVSAVVSIAFLSFAAAANPSSIRDRYEPTDLFELQDAIS